VKADLQVHSNLRISTNSIPIQILIDHVLTLFCLAYVDILCYAIFLLFLQNTALPECFIGKPHVKGISN